MVIGWQCIVPSLILCSTLCAGHTTLQHDETKTLVEKRSTGYPYDPVLQYFLMAMTAPKSQQHSPQLLNRGVRRLGSEFLGKRSVENNQSCDDCSQEDLENLKKEQLSFTGQYDYEGSADEPSDLTDQSTDSSPVKRNIQRFYGGDNRRGLKNFFSLLMSKKMGSEFLGKRMGSEFLGKRAMGSEFLGKRAMGSEFLGKRAMGSEFLGKRAMGSEFLGKRAMGSEFLGKRAMGSEFLGKRAMGSEFLGKRAMGSEFLGKRAMGSEFLGKRAMGSEFLGKRMYNTDFIPVSESGSKRAMGSEFLG